MSVATNKESSIIEQLNGPSDLLPRVNAFANLSAGTEFASYKIPQWQFLLGGQEITAFALHSSKENDNPDNIAFEGCVLRVKLNNDTDGFGMVLVDPSKRGRGFARLLIEKAMQVNDEEGKEKIFVLAVCSSLGRPLYSKLGFKDAGLVTLLTCSVSNLLKTKHRHWENECLLVNNGKECKNDELNLLINLDAKATGIERRERINLLLSGYSEGSRATVAFLSTDSLESNHSSAAVARQDCPEGPLIIGPMVGIEECCVPLMCALIEKHFEVNDRERNGDTSVMIMITDHPNLVLALTEVKGMNKLWQCPAMTSDGKPVYQHGDGSYLAMMHPTLG